MTTNKCLYTAVQLMLWLLLLVNGPNAIGQFNVSFDNIGVEQGLVHPQVRSIVKDKHGFIWIGTSNGLQRYDGYTLKTYQNKVGDTASLGGNLIRALLVDSKGDIWIGSRGGGLSKMSNGILAPWQLDSDKGRELAAKDIEALVEDHNGNIWIGTRNSGLWKLSNNTLTQYTHNPKDPSSLSSNAIYSLLVDTKNQIWAGTFGGGLNRLHQDGHFTHYRHNPSNAHSLSGDQIISLYQSKDETIWVGTWQHGLNKIIDDKIIRYNKEIGHPQISILSIAQDKYGHIWLGTWGDGLIRVAENDDINFFTSSAFNDNSLCNNYIESVFTDDTGTVWIGTGMGGISKIVQGDFTVYRAFSPGIGLQNEYISDVMRSRDSTLWMATYGGGLYKYKDKKYEHFQSNHPEGNSVWSIEEDKNGDIWAATEAGLLLLDRGKLRLKKLRGHGQGQDAIYTLSKTKAGEVICVTQIGDVYKMGNKNPMFISLSDIYPNALDYHQDSAYSFIKKDTKGRLWFGNQILKVVDSTQVLHLSLKDVGLERNLGMIHKTIFEDSKQQIWIGTRYGLVLYQEEEQCLKLYGEEDGLPNIVIRSIQEDHKGRLWLGTMSGLYCFWPDEQRYIRYTVADGLPGDLFTSESAFRDNNGFIYMGGERGLSIFHPDSLNSRPQFPLVLSDFLVLNQPVNSMERFGRPLEVVDSIELNYDENSFTFEVASLNYLTKDRQYIFQLSGFNKDISMPTTRRHVSYTNVNPGRYIFYAIDADNPQQQLVVSLVIHPPFWDTLGFKIILPCLASILLLSLYFRRMKLMKEQRMMLETAVKERTERIELQKDELEHQAMELGNTNRELEEKTTALLEQSDQLQDINDSLQEAKKDLQLLLAKEKNQSKQLKRALEELTNTQGQLVQSEKMASLGVLTAGIAHEINNPITFVLGGSEILTSRIKEIASLLRQYEQLEDASAEHLDEVKAALKEWKEEMDFDQYLLDESVSLIGDVRSGAKRIAEIVKGLHVFSRGGMSYPERDNIHRNIENTLVVLRNKYRDRIEINRQYEEGLPEVLCYSGKIGQVLINLLANAMQAIEGEGNITISTSTLEMEYVKVAISDTGVGMKESVKNKIFDPFFTTKEVGEGTGLGLYISRTIIEQHHGKIKVESEEGSGTTFSVILPIDQEPATQVNIKMTSED